MNWTKPLVGALTLTVGVIGVNFTSVYMPVQEALKYTDVISVASYYRLGIVPDMLVFDLRNVDWHASGALVVGRFFAFAEEFKDRNFREVRLAYKGRNKFILDADDFKEIGRENSWWNPV